MSTHARAVALSELPAALRATTPALIVSVRDSACTYTEATLERALEGRDIPVVRLAFDNVDRHITRHDIACTPAALAPLVEAVEALPADAFVLVHCSMGISRSPVIALLVRALQHPDLLADPEALVGPWALDHPLADPNMRVLACADAILADRGHPRRLLTRAWRDGPSPL